MSSPLGEISVEQVGENTYNFWLVTTRYLGSTTDIEE